MTGIEFERIMKKFKSYIFKNGGEKEEERKGKKEEYSFFAKKLILCNI